GALDHVLVAAGPDGCCSKARHRTGRRGATTLLVVVLVLEADRLGGVADGVTGAIAERAAGARCAVVARARRCALAVGGPITGSRRAGGAVIVGDQAAPLRVGLGGPAGGADR